MPSEKRSKDLIRDKLTYTILLIGIVGDLSVAALAEGLVHLGRIAAIVAC